MRCLYCGKELALLKRLTGGGDFCSEAHKQSYQEEYNRLALSRLLQAQKKKQQGSNSPVDSVLPAPEASVAVQESAPDDVATAVPDPPALAVALTGSRAQTIPEPAIESSQAKEPSSESAGPRKSVGAEPEPQETASFLLEKPAIADLPDKTPYSEPWLEVSGSPALSEWQFQNGAFSLSEANLLPLDVAPKPSGIQPPAVADDLSPQGFANLKDPNLSSSITIRNGGYANGLPATGVLPTDTAPASIAWDPDRSFLQAIQFESTAVFDDPQLLELPATTIDFPAEDADVVLPSTEGVAPALAELARETLATEIVAPEAPGPETTAPEATDENHSPRASLKALSQLHQELAEERARQSEEAPSAEPLEVVKSVAAEVIAPPRALPDAKLGAGQKTVEITAEATESAPDAGKPRFTTELFEISIKTFAPGKPVLIGGQPLPAATVPLLPQLKALPLRPKMALATSYTPPSTGSAPSPIKTATAVAVSPAPVAEGKRASQAAKTVAPAGAKIAESRSPAPQKAVSQKAEATKLVTQLTPSQPSKAAEATAANPGATEVSPKPAAVEKEEVPKPAPAGDQAKPATRQINRAADQVNADQVNKEAVPHFDIAQPGNVPWLSSLKLKLGLAILILVIACVYFLGWGGGKSGKPASSNAAVSADGSGPSIIMGEGGWVEGWSGDPAGMHAGRQITIYRPSLKLSDYRLEFQGSIDTKSLGWVFRASDPDNYYAMKLMAVSSGLSPKVALFKYLVANGKQTQVGRVPIDLAVQPDTVFDIRVDVRGPKFTTYIQGQPVDSWTDDQLKVGGAGFLNEREERGKVDSVSIRYLSGGAK